MSTNDNLENVPVTAQSEMRVVRTIQCNAAAAGCQQECRVSPSAFDGPGQSLLPLMPTGPNARRHAPDIGHP